MTSIDFKPYDTAFFRDGRPFEQSGGLAEAETRFPPEPTVLAGALINGLVRGLASAQGIDLPKDWDHLADLADDADPGISRALGSLVSMARGTVEPNGVKPRFTGPFLQIEATDGATYRYLPCPPLNVSGQGKYR